MIDSGTLTRSGFWTGQQDNIRAQQDNSVLLLAKPGHYHATL